MTGAGRRSERYPYKLGQLCALNFQEFYFVIYLILSNLYPGQATRAPGG
jgi:hypothetical protein